MLKSILTTTSLVGLIASASSADILVHVSPENLFSANGTQPLNIVMTSNPGTDQTLGAIAFDFDIGGVAWAVLNPTDFEWVPEVMNDVNVWFTTTDFPDPVAVSAIAAAAVAIPDGVDVTIASLTVTPQSGVGGDYLLGLGVQQLGDENAIPIQLKGGDPAHFTLDVPEPKSLMLLAVGASAMFRRRW